MINNTIKTVFLLTFLAVLFILVGGALGGTIGLIIGVGIALVMNFGAYWFSDKIVLKMHSAKEVYKGHELYDMTAELARVMKLPMPKVYLVHTPSPNAFATGRSPKHAAVAASPSLINLLSREELKAVMAHELSHVKHRDTLIQAIAVTIGASIAFIAEMMQWALIFGMGRSEDEGLTSLVGSIALLILAPIIAVIIQMAISRQREYMADAGAVQVMKTPMPLINALMKLEDFGKNIRTQPSPTKMTADALYISNPFKGGLMGLFSTHPATKDRIAAMKRVKIIR
ncbi:MAG: M48 family metalloprotease [Nanoarchaeota archaeon]|nr:M48 family metalloprotease [Nanoarchaeota archaeon]MEC8340005.1 M48 family metalloprotease [Nanoarchaeota archaeon]